MRPALLPALLSLTAVFLLWGCSTVPPGKPWDYSRTTVFPQPAQTPIRPQAEVLSQETLKAIARTTIQTAPNQRCVTNAYGVVRCFPVTNPPPPLGGFLIPFEGITNASNHSVAQTSTNLRDWTDIPAFAFGYSNYNPAMGTYLYASLNTNTGRPNPVYLMVANWQDAQRWYRIAYRP